MNLHERGVLLQQRIAEEKGVIGAHRDDNAGREKIRERVRGHFRHAFNGELHVRNGTHIEHHAGCGKLFDKGRILYRARPVLDATHAQHVNGPAHEPRTLEFSGVSLGDLSGIPGTSPVVRKLYVDRKLLRAMQVDAIEVVPAKRSLQQRSVARIVHVHHAADNAHFQTGRSSAADRSKELRP